MARLNFNKSAQPQPEKLLNNLSRTITDAQTLAQFALGADLASYEQETLGNYWHSIENLLNYAEQLCELFIDHFSPSMPHEISEVTS